jgi:hypothetical protein
MVIIKVNRPISASSESEAGYINFRNQHLYTYNSICICPSTCRSYLLRDR